MIHQMVGHVYQQGGWDVTAGCGVMFRRRLRDPLPPEVTAWASRVTCVACRVRQGLPPKGQPR